jgi:uncharacterized protein (TIGR00730 family)
MKKPAFSVCVYCASRAGDNPAFALAAQEVGRWIAQRNGQLVYGGGSTGLMGVLARAALEGGARVVGVIPQGLMEKELGLRECSELLVVETMHERKRIMAQRSDAFLALPGGIGTLDELFEIWTWRQLGYHDRPIGILNTDGYFTVLIEFLRAAVAHELLGSAQMQLVDIDDEPAPLLHRLIASAANRAQAQLDRT